MSYTIVTDSSANLPSALIEQYKIRVLPLTYRLKNVEHLSYIPNQPIDMPSFYNNLRNGETITTSCVSVDAFIKVFTELLTNNNDVLYIGLSSALSGTFQSASIAVADLKPQFPNRTILAVDSLAASLGQGLLITHAARKKEQGESIHQVYQWLIDNRLYLCHWFTVDDLFHLKRGGRISSATAVVGSLLNIKPILHVDNSGRLVPVSKVRGRKKSLNELVRYMEETAINPETQTIYISHGDCEEDARYVAELVQKKFGCKDILIDFVEPVIGAHSGPGTVALFFLGQHR